MLSLSGRGAILRHQTRKRPARRKRPSALLTLSRQNIGRQIVARGKLFEEEVVVVINLAFKLWCTRHWPTALTCVCLAFLDTGCATAPLEPTGSLTSYNSLVPSNGPLTKTRLKFNGDAILQAKTARILPTSFSGAAAQSDLTEIERSLVSNAIDRALCVGLSDRFDIVPPAELADLTVHAVITHVGLTDKVAAGASKVISIATTVVTKLLVSIPVPAPSLRIPVGLGGLSVEAEAIDRTGVQQAGLLWARGADIFTSKPTVSAASDAYDLAAAFGEHFSQLLVTGTDPIKAFPVPPSMQRIGFAMGLAPKYAACEAFGRSPGAAGAVGEALALPPDWTDKGAPVSPPPN